MISDAERYLMRGRSQLRDTPRALKDLTIAGLREDVSRLLDDDKALRAGLEDFRDHGTRHDVTPTIVVRLKSLFGLRDLGPPRTRGWYGYVKEMDDYVRQKARTVLGG